MICVNFYKFFKILLLTSIIFILNGCNSMLLSPHGTIAKQESSLILTSFIMMLFVVIPVLFMTIYFSVKYRSSNINQIYKPNWSESKIIETVVWIIPILIISFLALLTWNYCHILDPKKSIVSKYKPIKIDVIALDWRWLFIYPEYGIASINEIAFPTNRPVVFRITSNSVMNSFFIPSLGSQIYAMPGMITKLNLISNDSGKYKGISANYSGKGFSNMKFTVISLPNKKMFTNWINNIKNSPKKLNTIKMFNKVSLPNENHYVEYFSNVDKTLFNKIFH
ncbi:ubiquinol oxidase subunit II [Buchnera aphidicola (Aphis helianthi)]|uniref:Ubiquinol oxidase subunit 2 n=1 Tax=Buchnera aphidicola (Aphis helianthi) TaxID=2315802 RepID=A0A4D6XQR2_9GAMM|nr:ubiquinol oxidase subunit II [Buchnera aphidicola]QCI17274.1 ubiquinol oxidase subunit II [Buchnera aphidicola (Aphis helianthi)]